MYIKVFCVGGAICTVGQILIDKTKLTPARILVSFVCAGVILEIFGLYGKLVDFAGAGASVPISGFGYTLCRGVRDAVREGGAVGIIYGGIKAASGGIGAAIFFGYAAALFTKPKVKSKK